MPQKVKMIGYVLYREERNKLDSLSTMLVERGFTKPGRSYLIRLAIRLLDEKKVIVHLRREALLGRAKWHLKGRLRGSVKFGVPENEKISTIQKSVSVATNRIIRIAVLLADPRKALTQIRRETYFLDPQSD